MKQDLIDRFALLIHPLVLGTGRRLFPDGGDYAGLQLIDAKTTPNGVVVANYQPAKPAG
jgi:dihydrofolate reductase